MYVDANELVFKAIILYRNVIVFVLWLLGLTLTLKSIIIFSFLRKSIFLLHDVVVGVRLEIKNARELEVLVDLIVAECVEVEHNALQMQDQHVGCLCDECALADIHLLIAAVAVVVVDYLAFHLLCQAFVD